MTQQLVQDAFFDYDQLDSETRIVVQQLEAEYDRIAENVYEQAIRAGEILSDVRFRLRNSRPGFSGWLAHKKISKSTAYRLIQISEKTETYPELGQVSEQIESSEALSLLSSPSTPTEARQEIIERAEAGEGITYTTTKETIERHKNGNGHLVDTPAEYVPDWLNDDRSTYSPDKELDTAMNDTGSVCSECGQVYDGASCPDCKQSRMKPKENYKGDIGTSGPMDRCQTPPYAAEPLFDYIPADWVIWEPAAGEQYLSDTLRQQEFIVTTSDILTGENFFEFEPNNWDCLITNPPYSIKYQWLERCYQLGKPFALLLPVETLGAQTAQNLFKQYGVEVIFLDKRVDFKMPNKGWQGGGAQFPTAWFTWGLNIGQQMTFAKINKENGMVHEVPAIQAGDED